MSKGTLDALQSNFERNRLFGPLPMRIPTAQQLTPSRFRWIGCAIDGPGARLRQALVFFVHEMNNAARGSDHPLSGALLTVKPMQTEHDRDFGLIVG